MHEQINRKPTEHLSCAPCVDLLAQPQCEGGKRPFPPCTVAVTGADVCLLSKAIQKLMEVNMYAQLGGCVTSLNTSMLETNSNADS